MTAISGASVRFDTVLRRAPDQASISDFNLAKISTLYL